MIYRQRTGFRPREQAMPWGAPTLRAAATRAPFGALRWANSNGDGGLMAGHRGRQPNVRDGRPVAFKVKVTAPEARRLRHEAASLGITVARLLVEKALSRGESPAARRMVYAELIALRRDVRGFVTNANQLAHWANSEGRFPADAAQLAGRWEPLEARIAQLLGELRP